VPSCSNLRPCGSKCTVLKKVLATQLGLFGAAPSESAPVALCPPPPRHYYPASKWKTYPQNCLENCTLLAPLRRFVGADYPRCCQSDHPLSQRFCHTTTAGNLTFAMWLTTENCLAVIAATYAGELKRGLPLQSQLYCATFLRMHASFPRKGVDFFVIYCYLQCFAKIFSSRTSLDLRTSF